jgi:putative addiction module killer protein
VTAQILVTEVFSTWLEKLKDRVGRARIQARIERLAAGNPGQHRKLKRGVSELKIDVGPGYRVYYTDRGEFLVILLCGGDKSTQTTDVKLAYEMVENLEY